MARPRALRDTEAGDVPGGGQILRQRFTFVGLSIDDAFKGVD